MAKWETEWDRLNSFHLWFCAQPADFGWRDLANQRLTTAQHEERERLAQTAYFGWRTERPEFQTLGSNLPRIRHQGRGWGPTRCIVLAKTGPPTVGLGKLDQFPIEILSTIISALDISAIDRFKAANRRSYEVVNNHPHFKTINKQAHDTLRGLRAVKTSHLITVQTLFEKLSMSQCAGCGDYGGYMYLITFERVCCRCFTEKDRFLPLQYSDALKNFGLSLDIVRTLPHLQTYPGSYGRCCFRDKAPYTRLIDRASAHVAGIARHGSLEAMQEYVAKTDSKIWKSYKREIRAHESKLAEERALKKREKKARWRKREARKIEIQKRREERESRKGRGTESTEGVEDPSDNSDNESISTCCSERLLKDSDDDTKGDSDCKRSEARQTATGILCDEDSDEDDNCDRSSDDDHRYKVVIRVPWLNRKSGREEWGFHCVGCEGIYQWPNHANRDFIMPTFREHLKEYGPVRDRVHHTNNCCEKRTCRRNANNHSMVFENRQYSFWSENS